MHNLIRRILGVIIFVASILPDSQGQAYTNILKEVNIASPTASALTKYADIPVNNHTGIPQISLPIYSIKEGPLTHNLSLSYHAGGIKTAEMASWVGTGWSLNAGGVISRTVRGTPDEFANAANSQNLYGHLSHGGYNSYLMKPNSFSPLPSGEVGQVNDIQNGVADGEPDLFFFNLGGKTGKFYFHDDGSVVLLPQQDVRITYTYTHVAGHSISSFVITTPDGVQYFFGRTVATTDVDPIELTFTHQYEDGFSGTNTLISSWYLNKIISADNRFSISFNYQAESYTYIDLVGFPINSLAPQSSYEYKLAQNWIQGVRLSNIIFTDGRVDLNPGAARQDVSAIYAGTVGSETANSDAKMLGSISISNSNTTFCKKFSFAYSYFQDNNSGLPPKFNSAYALSTDRKRLRLDTLKESSCDNSLQLPPHTFEYFTEQLPRRITLNQDHWGFSNQKNNQKLRPTYIEERLNGELNEFEGADRSSSWPAMRAGTLRKINYPTGGSTEFDFEANTAWLSYNKTTKTYVTTFSTGYDGNPTPSSITIPSAGNMYTLKLVNSSGGGTASLNGLIAQPGETLTKIVKPAGGNFTINLSKQSPLTGHGAEAFIYEWIPTLYEGNETVGGLRIKKISSSTEPSGASDVVVNYEYNEANGKSSGHVYSRPTYVQIIRNDYLQNPGYLVPTPDHTGHCPPNLNGCVTCTPNYEYVISPNSIRPLATTQGNHIGYNEVKISQANNGYTINRYFGSPKWDMNTSNLAVTYIKPTVCDKNSIPDFPGAPEPHDFRRGELKYTAAFNSVNQLISEVDYLPVYVNNPVTTPALRTSSSYWFPGLPTFYLNSTAKLQSMKTTETTYSASTGYLQKVTDVFYESSYHNQPTRVTTTGSRGEVNETKYKYASDFRVGSCDQLSDGYQTYLTAFQAAVTQYNTDMLTTSTAYWKYWNYQKMLKTQSEARKAYLVTSKARNNPSNPAGYAACFGTALSAADIVFRPILELQKSYQNPVVEETQWRDGLTIGGVVQKFTMNGTNVYPYQSFRLATAVPLTSFAPSIITGNSLTFDSRYVKEAEALFENGLVKEVRTKSGIVTSYLWPASGATPIARAVGVSHSILSSAYVASGNSLTTLRGHASMAPAMLTTYEYKPLVGISTEFNINARKTAYEYDALGRLKLIRDHDNAILKKICYSYHGGVGACDAAPPANATITLLNLFVGNPFPANITIEFIQGSTVVQTQTFPATNNGSKTITLPQGTYQFRFTMPHGFQNYWIAYAMGTNWWESSSGLIINTGQVIIDGNKTIVASNSM